MSQFTDFLEFDLGVVDLGQIEPEEIKVLCDDPIFRKVAEYCLRTRGTKDPRDDDPCYQGYDRDELGIDPEQDVEHA